MTFVSDTRRFLAARAGDWQDPCCLARSFLTEEHLHYDDESPDPPARTAGYTLRKWRGEYYAWQEGVYRRVSDETVRVRVTRWLQDNQPMARMATGSDVRITRTLLSNVLLNMDPMILIRESFELNAWLDDSDRPPAIAVGNGLLLFDGEGTSPADPTGPGLVLRPHTPNYFTLARLPFDYDPEARCPAWRRFLAEATCGRADLAILLQQWVGYLFRHDLGQQKFLLCVGEGANGKGVFFEVVQRLVGRDNCSQVPLARFANPFALAATVGKLVNATNESSGLIDPEAEALLKAFVAGDRFTFERKYREPVSATPTAKVMIATNALPRFTDKTQGLWRRVLLVPFDRIVDEEDQDRDLAGRIATTELPGVFLWAMEGLRLLNRHGFTVPEVSRTMLEEHRRDVDPAREFLLSNYAASEEYEGLPAAEVYDAYCRFCEANGCRPTNAANFGRQVRRTFPTVEKARRREGRAVVSIYQGLAVLEDSEVAGDRLGSVRSARGARGNFLFVEQTG